MTLLYHTLLNRAPDSGGLSYFVGELNGGTSRQTVVGQFLATDEHHAVVVNFYFQLYLGRAPSSSDSSYWVSQFDAGMTELSFQQDLVGSTEYATIPPALAGGSVYRLTS